MPCPGAGDDKRHCCYLNGEPCQYVERRTVPGREWACGLRRELGGWGRVLADPRYQENVKPKLPKGINCRDYPEKPAGQRCTLCGFGVSDGN